LQKAVGERIFAMSLKRSPHLLFACVISAGMACVTPEPPRGPAPTVDATELFRRARFKELSRVSRESFAKVIDRLRPKSMSPADEMLDFAARSAYRAGDGQSAREAISSISPASRTRAILDALLANVDLTSPLNQCTLGGTGGLITIPLDPDGLDAGYSIVSARVGDRDARLLWDTGATENVISEELASWLLLPTKHVQFTLHRGDDALVVRFDATGLPAIDVGELHLSNVTAIISELHTVESNRGRMALDGFLSPQLLVRGGCFAIDRAAASLTVAVDATLCRSMMATSQVREPLFTWDGEVFVNARVHESADLSVQLETGSPVTYLRADAARHIPKGLLRAAPDEREGEIAHEMGSTVLFSLAGRARRVSAIDLEPRRQTNGHDDIGTVGADVLLERPGFMVSFATMELGFPVEQPPYADAAGEPLP
jgi:aspartyl protease